MGQEPSSAIDITALSQVLGIGGGWLLLVLGIGWFVWMMATDRLVAGRRLEQLQEAYDREQERGDVLARTLLELQPGVKLAVHTVEQFRSLTINGGPPTDDRQGITS
jgi:hypothetical protein